MTGTSAPTGEKYDLPLPRQLAVNILMRALLPDKTGDYVTESAKMADFPRWTGGITTSLAAYSCGVVAGDDQGRFNPKSGLTRAEACTIIRRAQVLSGQETPALPDTPGSLAPRPRPRSKRAAACLSTENSTCRGRSSATSTARRWSCTA